MEDRLRIYIDTSVLGGCFDDEFSAWSNSLVRDFRMGRFIPVLSDVTAAEVAEAPEAVRGIPGDMLRLAGSLLPVPGGGQARGILPIETDLADAVLGRHDAHRISDAGGSRRLGELELQAHRAS